MVPFVDTFFEPSPIAPVVSTATNVPYVLEDVYLMGGIGVVAVAQSLASNLTLAVLFQLKMQE